MGDKSEFSLLLLFIKFVVSPRVLVLFRSVCVKQVLCLKVQYAGRNFFIENNHFFITYNRVIVANHNLFELSVDNSYSIFGI